MYQKMFVLFILFFSMTSLAHEGHDHESVNSAFIHLLWLAPLLIGAIALFIHLVKSQYSADD